MQYTTLYEVDNPIHLSQHRLLKHYENKYSDNIKKRNASVATAIASIVLAFIAILAIPFTAGGSIALCVVSSILLLSGTIAGARYQENANKQAKLYKKQERITLKPEAKKLDRIISGKNEERSDRINKKSLQMAYTAAVTGEKDVLEFVRENDNTCRFNIIEIAALYAKAYDTLTNDGSDEAIRRRDFLLDNATKASKYHSKLLGLFDNIQYLVHSHYKTPSR